MRETRLISELTATPNMIPAIIALCVLTQSWPSFHGQICHLGQSLHPRDSYGLAALTSDRSTLTENAWMGRYAECS